MTKEECAKMCDEKGCTAEEKELCLSNFNESGVWIGSSNDEKSCCKSDKKCSDKKDKCCGGKSENCCKGHSHEHDDDHEHGEDHEH